MYSLKAALLRQLVLHFGDDVPRIDHALQVLDHAEALLAEIPEADSEVVLAAAVMHDFGIREAERLHGRCDGPLQEKYGPPLVRKALQEVGMDPRKIREVSAIVARHHSPPQRPSINYRILYESDWLVNVFAMPNLLQDTPKLGQFIEKNFHTAAGKQRAYRVFLQEDSIFVRMGNVYQLMIDEEKRRVNEEPYLLKLAKAARSKPVLDLACGTGFHSRLFAAHGYRVIGLDYSRSMLQEARHLTKEESVTYQWADLLQPLPIKEKAGLGLLLGNTLSVFQTKEDLRKVFQNAAKALAPGGILVCQILNYQRMHSQPGSPVTKQGEVDGKQTVLTKSLQMVDRNHVLLTFTASQPSAGGEWQTRAESTLLRAWSPKDLAKAASAAGLDQIALWGSLSQSSFAKDQSTDCVLEFRKKI